MSMKLKDFKYTVPFQEALDWKLASAANNAESLQEALTEAAIAAGLDQGVVAENEQPFEECEMTAQITCNGNEFQVVFYENDWKLQLAEGDDVCWTDPDSKEKRVLVIEWIEWLGDVAQIYTKDGETLEVKSEELS
jgi:hypothetical protein